MNVIGKTNDGELIVTMSAKDYETLALGKALPRPPAGDIGARVAHFRRHWGYSQRQVAAAVGISRNYLSDLEKGIRGNPSSKIRDALDDFMKEVTGGEND